MKPIHLVDNKKIYEKKDYPNSPHVLARVENKEMPLCGANPLDKARIVTDENSITCKACMEIMEKTS